MYKSLLLVVFMITLFGCNTTQTVVRTTKPTYKKPATRVATTTRKPTQTKPTTSRTTASKPVAKAAPAKSTASKTTPSKTNPVAVSPKKIEAPVKENSTSVDIQKIEEKVIPLDVTVPHPRLKPTRWQLPQPQPAIKIDHQRKCLFQNRNFRGNYSCQGYDRHGFRLHQYLQRNR